MLPVFCYLSRRRRQGSHALGALPGLLSQTRCTSPTRNLGPGSGRDAVGGSSRLIKSESECSEWAAKLFTSVTLSPAPGHRGTRAGRCGAHLTTWQPRWGGEGSLGFLGLHPCRVALGRSLHLPWPLRNENNHSNHPI